MVGTASSTALVRLLLLSFRKQNKLSSSEGKIVVESPAVENDFLAIPMSDSCPTVTMMLAGLFSKESKTASFRRGVLYPCVVN